MEPTKRSMRSSIRARAQHSLAVLRFFLPYSFVLIAFWQRHDLQNISNERAHKPSPPGMLFFVVDVICSEAKHVESVTSVCWMDKEHFLSAGFDKVMKWKALRGTQSSSRFL